jgi:dTDP-4-dehydrorhamnose 3,5-epimerase
MRLSIESVHFGTVVVLGHERFEDERGLFMETFRADEFRKLGLPTEFVQDNLSRSSKHVLRGLHFQWDRPMGKLMRVAQGRAFLVAVDIRKDSPTLGQWFGIEVAAEDRKQVWAPAGFARGFLALSDGVEIQYKCTATYNRLAESGIRWNDPAVAIDWPVTQPILSAKDEHARTLADWLASSDSDHFRVSAPHTPGALVGV